MTDQLPALPSDATDEEKKLWVELNEKWAELTTIVNEIKPPALKFAALGLMAGFVSLVKLAYKYRKVQ